MARRARQQEQQKRKEAEREAAMGFNPKPSKFMDLDQLQHQGMEERGEWRDLKGEISSSILKETYYFFLLVALFSELSMKFLPLLICC